VSQAATEFLELFRDEARERLDRIVETLLELETGRAPAGAIDALMREMHTIKGAAGMVGLDDICVLAHAAEDILAIARERGSFPPSLTDPLLRTADALRRQVEGSGEPVEDLVAELVASATQLGPAAQTAPIERGPERRKRERRSIRVASEKVDTLLDLVGEAVLHRGRLEHVLGAGEGNAGQSVADELDVGERLFDSLKSAAVGMRTLPLSSIAGPLPRAVRDLAAETGKEAELVIDGAETELDRTILEGLAEPLAHLLRNAIAHGIEAPAERERLGKPRCGHLQLRAEQRGGIVEVTLADDGRGVSVETVEQARSVGSLAETLAQAGFSTAGEVSEISGRGAGFGAVKAQVESFGGSVEVLSEPGEGTQVMLRLPLALALLEVLLVERAGTVYGLPLANVEEAISLGEILTLGGRTSVELRGSSVPLADLAELMGQPAPALPEGSPAIVVTVSGSRLAAGCDVLLGKEEVIVKSLGPLLTGLPAYLGAAILGDGRIALLADPARLVRGTAPKLALAGSEPSSPPVEAETPKVLVVEDSFIVRELQRSILEAAGYRVETARNGREALDHLDRDEAIELVLTDLEMPEMGGIELTETIRATPARSTLPVVIVTSRGEEHERQGGIEAGADAYMVKQGFDQHALLETVERLVGR
jgi:two-component system chemotaxis sensor kinase CheA